MRTYFDVYLRRLQFSGLKYDEDAASEVVDRLWQSEYALSQLNAIIKKFFANTENNANPGDYQQNISQYISLSNEIFSEGRFYAESYYYFAFRVIKLLTRKDHPFPFLKGFKSDGVLLTRNHLIEHPEGAHSRALKCSYSFDEKLGALLRTSNDPNQMYRDKGTIENSDEFKTNFINAIINATVEIYKINQHPSLKPLIHKGREA